MDEKEGKRLNDALQDVNALMKVLNKEDDRGAVMSLAAFFEEVLGRLLSAFLRDTKSSKEILTGFNAPLGTLSSRIKAAHALGLLSDAEFADCERLRKIRNEFAHSWAGVSLDRDDIKTHILNLSDRFGINKENTPLGLRMKNSLSATLVALEVLAISVQRVKQQDTPISPVNRRRNGTPYRLPKGTPASSCIGSARVGPGLSI